MLHQRALHQEPREVLRRLQAADSRARSQSTAAHLGLSCTSSPCSSLTTPWPPHPVLRRRKKMRRRRLHVVGCQALTVACTTAAASLYRRVRTTLAGRHNSSTGLAASLAGKRTHLQQAWVSPSASFVLTTSARQAQAASTATQLPALVLLLLLGVSMAGMACRMRRHVLTKTQMACSSNVPTPASRTSHMRTPTTSTPAPQVSAFHSLFPYFLGAAAALRQAWRSQMRSVQPAATASALRSTQLCGVMRRRQRPATTRSAGAMWRCGPCQHHSCTAACAPQHTSGTTSCPSGLRLLALASASPSAFSLGVVAAAAAQLLLQQQLQTQTRTSTW